MYSIIETGGKQYKVEKGDVITVEKLGVEAGKKVVFDKVLVESSDNGLKVGAPYIDGATVEGKVVENGKAKKVVVFKYKAKKDSKSKQGHRQPYTMVEISKLGGASSSAKKSAAKAEAKEAKKVSASMKKDELIAYAKENGIEIDAKAKKADILEAIQNAGK